MTNVCLANTLIIPARANKIDNYILYTENSPFPSVTAPSITVSTILSPQLIGIFFPDSSMAFFHLSLALMRFLSTVSAHVNDVSPCHCRGNTIPRRVRVIFLLRMTFMMTTGTTSSYTQETAVCST